MPLSEEEQRLLRQLEQSLAAEDPDFASTLRGSKLRAHNRRVATIAAFGFVAGIALLLAGAVLANTYVGVIGFVAMLAGAYVFLDAWRKGIANDDGEDEELQSTQSPPSKPSGSFVDRMEERWNKRQQGDGF